MSRRVQVIVQTEPETPYDWRRFVAILCFIEFFWQFVAAGQDLAEEPLRFHERRTAEAQLCIVLDGVVRMVRACAFYACGRSLWYSRGPTIWYLCAAIILSMLTVATATVKCVVFYGRYYLGALHSQYGIEFTDVRIIAAFFALNQLPWLAILVTALWSTPRDRYRWRSQPWIWPAAAWCLGAVPMMAVRIFPCDGSVANALSTSSAASYLWCVLPILAGVCLLAHRREARTFAFCTVMVFAVPTAWNLYHWDLIIHAFILSLWGSAQRAIVDFMPRPSPWTYLLLNRGTFRWMIIDMIARVGPWLLIALYAWRVPMTAAPDDGSPFPRSFCGRCRYNLHGLDHPERCPECGSALDWSRVAEAG